MALESLVIFACTGNRFRSMTAEYCLRQYLVNHGIEGMSVGSAGTRVSSHKVHDAVKRSLDELGIDISRHVPRQLTPAMIPSAGSGILVAMAMEHKEYLEEAYKVRALLYREIVEGKVESVFDINDVVEDWRNNEAGCEKHIREVIMYLHESAPEFYVRVQSQL